MTILRADAVGLSVAGEGGAPSLIAWSEIQALVGSKVDCIEHEELVIELEHESGTVFSLASSTEGFQAASEAFARHLPGLAAEWLERAGSIPIQADPVQLWRRGGEAHG